MKTTRLSGSLLAIAALGLCDTNALKSVFLPNSASALVSPENTGEPSAASFVTAMPRWVLSGAAAPGEVPQAERGQRSAVASSLIGTARAKDGNPLEGVVISARAAEKSYSTSVFSDAQ